MDGIKGGRHYSCSPFFRPKSNEDLHAFSELFTAVITPAQSARHPTPKNTTSPLAFPPGGLERPL